MKLFKRLLVLTLLMTILSSFELTFTSVKATTYTPVDWISESGFKPYLYSDKKPVLDPAGDVNPTASDITSGLSSGTGKLPSVYIGSRTDSGITTLFFRFRVKGDPYDIKGGFTSTAWLLQLWNNGSQIATIGLNGKESSVDYVYVANGDGSLYTPIYSTSYATDGKGTLPGTRIVPALNGQYFIDFQIPLSALNTSNIGRNIDATTPLTLMYGTSQAANLSVINKEWLSNSSGQPAVIEDFYTLNGGFNDVATSSNFLTASEAVATPTLAPIVQISKFACTVSQTCANGTGTYSTFTTDNVTVFGVVLNYKSAYGPLTLKIDDTTPASPLLTTITPDSSTGAWSLNLADYVPSVNGTHSVSVTLSNNSVDYNATDYFSVLDSTNSTEKITITSGLAFDVTNTPTPTLSGGYTTKKNNYDIYVKFLYNSKYVYCLASKSPLWNFSNWSSGCYDGTANNSNVVNNVSLPSGTSLIEVFSLDKAGSGSIIASTRQYLTYKPADNQTIIPLSVSISGVKSGTSLIQPTIYGTSIPDTSILLANRSIELILTSSLGTASLGNVQLNSDGTWEYTLDFALTPGNYTFTAVIKDNSGKKVSSDTFNMTVANDTFAITINNGAEFKTGDTQPTISGTATLASGTTINLAIFNGVSTTNYTVPVTNGKWYMLPSNPLATDASGSKLYRLTATAGTASAVQDLYILSSKPQITLNDSSSLDLVVGGSAYVEYGAFSKDTLDTNINNIALSNQNIQNPIVSNVPGIYVVRYNISNKYGISADEVTRTVSLFPNELTAVGSVNGAKTVYVSGIISGATVELYNNLMVKIATSTQISGTTYTFTDVAFASGYRVKQTVNSLSGAFSNAVNVTDIDRIIPIIEFVSDSNMYALNSSSWSAPNPSASDNLDGDLTGSVIKTYSSQDLDGTSVDSLASARSHLQTIGHTVLVKYNVKDSSNNAAVEVAATFTSVAKDVTSISLSGSEVVEQTLTTSLNPSLATGSYQWYRSSTQNGQYSLISNATSANYTLVAADVGQWIKVVFTANGNYQGSVSDVKNNKVSKKVGPSTPSSPTLLETLATQIKVETVNGQEYSIDGINWQTSGVFNGLTPEHDYTVYTRIQETDVRYPSNASQGNAMKTPAQYRVKYYGWSDSQPLSDQWVTDGKDATPPAVQDSSARRFVGWSASSDSVHGNKSIYAQYEEITGTTGLNPNANSFLAKLITEIQKPNTQGARLTVTSKNRTDLTSAEQGKITEFLTDHVIGDIKHEYILDASLFVTYDSVESQVHEASSAIDITIDIPQGFDTEELQLIRIHDGVTTVLPYTVSQGKLTFSSQLFSTYALVTAESTPTLTLLGNATTRLVVGSTFTDAGVVANDTLDADIQSKIVVGGTVNTSIVGTYTLTYDVTNKFFKSATQLSRSVLVLPAAPSATGSTGGIQTVTVSGATPGSTLKLYDSTGTLISTKTADESGSYTFTVVNVGAGYTVTQTVSGLESQSSAPVNVSGQYSIPVIVSVSNANVYAIAASSWSAPSTTASDSVQGDLSAQINRSYWINNVSKSLQEAQAHLQTVGNQVVVLYDGVRTSNGIDAAPVRATFTSIAMPITSIAIQGNLIVGKTLETILDPSASTVSYQWYRADSEHGNYAAIDNATNSTYTLTSLDVGHFIRVVALGQTRYVGNVSDHTSGIVAKMSGPQAPSAPFLKSVDQNSIEVDVVTGQEYSIDGGQTWQDSGLFGGLDPHHPYTILTRIKATDDQEASSYSNGLDVSTKTLITVRIVGIDATTLRNSQILTGSSPTMPSVAGVNHRRFVGWSQNISQVLEDTTIYAQYEEVDSDLNSVEVGEFLSKIAQMSSQKSLIRGARLTVNATQISSLIQDEQTLLIDYIQTEVSGSTKHNYVFDASLYVSIDGSESPVTETTSALSISMDVPQAFIGRNFQLVRLHDYGEGDIRLETVAYTYDETTHRFSFSTDKFSTYALVYGESDSNAYVPDPNSSLDDNTPLPPTDPIQVETKTTTIEPDFVMLPNTGVATNMDGFGWMIVGLILLAWARHRTSTK